MTCGAPVLDAASERTIMPGPHGTASLGENQLSFTTHCLPPAPEGRTDRRKMGADRRSYLKQIKE